MPAGAEAIRNQASTWLRTKKSRHSRGRDILCRRDLSQKRGTDRRNPGERKDQYRSPRLWPRHCREGMTTEEIDRLVHEKTEELGGIPAPLGYEGFPKSICPSMSRFASGHPSEDIVLKDGDIINVDVSTIYNGYFSDSSRMFCIGNVSDEKKKLVDVTKECVELGLAQVKPWGFIGDMGQAVHDHAVKNGYSVVREIGGHGVGLEFHEEPFVSYVTKKGTEMLLVPGMVFTIEPMVNMGTDEVYTDGEDNWSVYTADGLPSAQWEIQVLVTETGYEVLAY